MLTSAIYPPVADDVLLREEREASLRELAWLLEHLQKALTSLRAGLSECLALLQPTQPGSTLVLSTVRSEGLKGYITRVGTRIVKGEMQVRMYPLSPTKGLNYYRLQLAPGAEMMLDQLTDVRNFVSSALHAVESDDAETDAMCMMEKVNGVLSDIRAAKDAMSGTGGGHVFPYHALDPKIFDPPLPSNLSVDITISDAAIIADLRTLDPIPILSTISSIPSTLPHQLQALTFNPALLTSGFGFRERIFGLGGKKQGEEDDTVYTYKGVEVKVKERVRVESQDPSLMSVLAKLGALEHNLMLARKNLVVCMEAAEML